MKHFLLLSALFWSSNVLVAQESAFRKFLPTVGIGYGVWNENLLDGGVYNPIILIGRSTVFQLSKQRGNGFSVYVESQLVAVSVREFRRRDYEFGGNLGFEYRTSLWLGSLFETSIGSGPHYITVVTRHQARGFIFSDNFEMALSQALPKGNAQLQLRFRYRHISNAGLQEPNLGIDNVFVFAGFAKSFK